MRYNNPAPARKRRDGHPEQSVSTLRCASQGSRNCRETRPRLDPRATASAPAEAPGNSLGRHAAGPPSSWAAKTTHTSDTHDRQTTIDHTPKTNKQRTTKKKSQ